MEQYFKVKDQGHTYSTHLEVRGFYDESYIPVGHTASPFGRVGDFGALIDVIHYHQQIIYVIKRKDGYVFAASLQGLVAITPTEYYDSYCGEYTPPPPTLIDVKSNAHKVVFNSGYLEVGCHRFNIRTNRATMDHIIKNLTKILDK